MIREIETLKEQNRSVLADRAQVIKKLSKVQEANEKLATALRKAEDDLALKENLAIQCESLEQQLEDMQGQLHLSNMAVDLASQEVHSIAKAIHYPDCWDEAAYPTLLSAISEVGCNVDNCEMRVSTKEQLSIAEGKQTLSTSTNPAVRQG